jgi:hypothetical protein
MGQIEALPLADAETPVEVVMGEYRRDFGYADADVGVDADTGADTGEDVGVGTDTGVGVGTDRGVGVGVDTGVGVHVGVGVEVVMGEYRRDFGYADTGTGTGTDLCIYVCMYV